jgi:hypothetical protein
MNKKTTFLATVAILTLAVLVYHISLLRSEVLSLREEANGHAEDIYFLMRSDSARLYTIMDTEVRILHYAKPHKHPMWACPECAEQKDREKLNAQKEIQDQSRHKQGTEGVGEAGP